MPDQPDDPIHYEMKIPPEPKDAPLNKQESQHGEGESNKVEEDEKKQDRPASGRDQSQDR